MSSPAGIQYTTNLKGFVRQPAPPRTVVPAGACDSHMHIVGPFSRFPLRETRSVQPTEGTLEDYLDTMRRTRIQRAVVVQPSWYARDHACTLHAAEALGENGRAVVVVAPDVQPGELRDLHERGARGVRLQNQVAGGTSVGALLDIAARIAPLGWHIQLFLDASELVELAPVIRASPVPVVIDHMAHLRGEKGDSPGLRMLCELLAEGKTWVKLSNTRFLPDPDRAAALVRANPERVLWGTDWPHVAFEGDTPGEGELLDALAACVPDEATRRRILVDNPSALYFEGR